MQVLLASTSPARLMLLRQAGIEPLLHSPGVDEDAAVADLEAELGHPLSPTEHVQVLASLKAAAMAEQIDAVAPGFDGIVIGGDSMFELDGTVYGKPHEPAVARERWQRMRGRTGVLYSGHSVLRVRSGVVEGQADAVAAASVSFVDDLTDAELDAYIASGEPLQVAGAFTLDSLGGPFIDRIEGEPSTVIGMSLSTLRRLAARLGVAWPTLWNR
ncbi:Maf family protein [Microbacterium sp. ZW T5_56]|uniref:Maf family protein n=1 Tax=Microbacterium sp. ZW T5_56 TaxID=3378081 RepID=UPI003854C50C